MRPVILTNAFRRPRATETSKGRSLADDGTNVYACVEELIEVITDDLQACPLMVPTSFDAQALASILDHVDGILLPGAVSNMHPSLYGQEVEVLPQTFDRAHDTLDLFLVREARRRHMPFFGICRAMQAMNVAAGGTLHQKIEATSLDHCCSYPCDGRDDADIYMHTINPQSGGRFAQFFPGEIGVNSMHEQAVDQVGQGLFVEARASDGVIEALSQPDEDFFIGVQWHPEAMPKQAVSQILFGAFREAVQRFACRRAS